MYIDVKFQRNHELINCLSSLRPKIVLQFSPSIHIFYRAIEILYWIISASID